MGNEIVQYNMSDVEKIGNVIAKSGLFGIKTSEAAIALCLIAQAEGRHPVEAARDYHVINGKPSKTADAMLRDFLSSRGSVKWHSLSDTEAKATFSHPTGGEVTIDWDMDRAKKAGITGNPTWSKYPRAMLRARVVSEGIRTVYPGATSGFYEKEEVRDFTADEKPMQDVTPKLSDPAPIDEAVETLKLQCRDAAGNGGKALDEFLKSIPKDQKKHLAVFGPEMRKIAIEADAMNQEQAGTEIPP